MFILEGIPSVILGIVTIFYLTDWPHEAKWLPEDEKQWITGELDRERKEKMASGKDDLWQGLKEGLLNPKTLLLCLIYISIVTGFYGLTMFLPSIAEKMVPGTSTSDMILKKYVIPAVPYVFGLVGMLWNSAHSDKTGERRWHTVWPLLFGAVTLSLSLLTASSVIFAFTFLCLTGIGVLAYLPVFWTWPSRFLAASAAAAAVGLINSFGNLGGYLGPKVVGWLSVKTGNYASGQWFLVACILVSGLLALMLKQSKKEPAH